MPGISSGLTPDSITEDTKAANPGAAEPLSVNSSGVDEVQSVERMRLVLDAAVHVRAANLASVPLDRRRRVDHVKFVAVLQNGHAVARDHGDHRKGGPVGFPAFGAAAGVVVGDVSLDADLDRPVSLHLQTSVPPAKLPATFLNSVVNRWNGCEQSWPILLVFDVFVLERDFD